MRENTQKFLAIFTFSAQIMRLHDKLTSQTVERRVSDPMIFLSHSLTITFRIALHLLLERLKYLDNVIQSRQIPVLVISHLPMLLVSDFNAFRRRTCFGKVN